MYQPAYLRRLVTRISAGEEYNCVFPKRPASWSEISRLIHGGMGQSDEAHGYIESFAKLWKELARDFLAIDVEYNSIKHGLRAIPQAMEWAVGPHNEEPVVSDLGGPDWIPLSNARYGSWSFLATKIEGAPGYHRQIEQFFEGWHPVDMLHALTLISVSLHNLIQFLKVSNKIIQPHETKYRVPQLDGAFSLPWREKHSKGAVRAQISFTRLTKKEIKLFTKADIRSRYQSGEDE